jgi:hypothetical protein
MPDTPYFTVEEFRDVYPDVANPPYTDARINAARATAEEIIEGLDAEDGAHVAFVPRTETFKASGSGGTRVSIPRYRLRAVSEIKLDGVVQALDGIVVEASSVFSPHWPSGFSNLELTVEHGWDAPPGRIKDAAILLTYHRLVKGPIDDRATAITPDSGGVIQLATPGRAGYVTGIPEVDAAIQQYAKKPPRIRSIVTTDRGNSFPGNDWLGRYSNL